MSASTPPVLRWYFDFISPFAYLHWRKLRSLARERPIELVPVALGAVLAAHGQKGPAEIRGKREFTYQHVLWLARREGVPLRFPPAHPFNPLTALRLSIVAGNRPATASTRWNRSSGPSAWTPPRSAAMRPRWHFARILNRLCWPVYLACLR